MTPALIQLFVFMTCTFVLGLFLGWSLWRYGGVSRAAMNDLEAKVEFWKKSLDQSRNEFWKLQEETDTDEEDETARRSSKPTSRRRVSKATSSLD